MNAIRPALPEPTIAAWGRTARPVRLTLLAASRSRSTSVGVRAVDDDTDQVDDLMFGCSAAALMAIPWILLAGSLFH